MGLHGSENFKMLLLQITAKYFEAFLNFLPNAMASPIFNDFFFRKFQIHQCSVWRNKKP